MSEIVAIVFTTSMRKRQDLPRESCLSMRSTVFQRHWHRQCFSSLQCKTFGNHEIPEGWVIVAAGNPPEYNKSVREFDVVTLDRVKKIMVEPDYRIWKEYAYKENIHPAILAYLELRSNCFYQMETTIDGRQFATPRGWEDLSRMMEVYERLNKNITREVVGQYIQHDRISVEFAGYLRIISKIPTGLPDCRRS